MVFSNNSIINTTHAGLMLKESLNCSVWDNLFSGNREGLAVWNSSYNDIREIEQTTQAYFAGAQQHHINNMTREQQSHIVGLACISLPEQQP
jgi:parallel beta-helix repeat protein